MNVLLVADRRSPVRGNSKGKRARKSDAVYQDLKRKILTGEMTSESPITEQSLAQDYGCAQSTIREALMLLQKYGLVEWRGCQGTFVTNPSLLEARLMLKLRLNIEATGIVETVNRVSQDQLDEIIELDDRFEECRHRRDVFGCAEADRAMHLKLFKIANMPVLEPVLVRTFMILQRVMLSTPRPEVSWTRPNVTPHRTIIDAIAARNVQVALEALQSHLLSSAVLLAPHFYGTDLALLQDQFEAGPVQLTGLAGR